MNVGQLLRGPGARPEPVDRPLRAGPLAAVLRGVDLAHVRLGTLPLVRLVHGAVRDALWGTVEPVVSEVGVTSDEQSFAVTFTATHASDDVAFAWRGAITGTADGTIVYELDGSAPRACLYSRIGLCVLHPLPTSAGRPFRARLDGDTFAGTLPVDIAAQPFVDGCYTPAVPPFDELELDIAPGVVLRFTFEGDQFELEDQRNWTDATFKTYSTPLRLGGPHRLEAGQRLRQRLTIATRAAAASGVGARTHASGPRQPVGLRITRAAGSAMPPLGAVAARGAPLPATYDDLGLAHVRVELDLEAGEQAPPAGLALPAGTELELAVWTSVATAPRAVDAVRTAAAVARVARVIVLDADADVLDPDVAGAVRHALREAGLELPLGGGSDYWFAEVHRSPHDLAQLDFLAFSITPQLHTFDDESIFETVAIQPEVVATSRTRVASGHVAISPLTLVPRDSGAVRASVPAVSDPRQHALFGAAWAAASIGSLASAGACSLTCFDLTGPGGVLRADGSCHPVGLVLAAASAWRGLPVVGVESDAPGRVRAWAVEDADFLRVAITNCTPEAQLATLQELAPGAEADVTRLDASALQAGASSTRPPSPDAVTVGTDGLRLELPPYAVTWVVAPPRKA